VLEAVRGWEFHAKLPHVGESEEGSDVVEEHESSKPQEESEEVWSPEELDKELDGLLRSDYVSLLLEHEQHIRSPPSESRELLPSCSTNCE